MPDKLLFMDPTPKSRCVGRLNRRQSGTLRMDNELETLKAA
jgi:hypothetical protein